MAKKAQLGYKEIEERLTALRDGSLQADSVGYQLLYAFGKSERDIQRYREGKGVMKTFDGLLINGLFCYRGTMGARNYESRTSLCLSLVNNFNELLR